MTTNTTSRLVRYLVIIVLSLATAGMVAVSLRANYLFGYGFGQTPEKAFVFGWANVAADLWKVAGLIVIAGLWRARQRRIALSLLPIWALCLLWGLVGAIGVYAQDRTALIGGREATSATYKDKQRELEEIEVKLRSQRTTRTVAEIDAAITAVFARPIMGGERVRGTTASLSANCTSNTKLTAVACEEIASLRTERAGAEETSRLEAGKSRLRQELTMLRAAGGSLAADPVGELFAWLSRGQLSVHDIGFGFPLVFAVLIEVVSAFGPAGIVAYAEATRPTAETDMARHGRLHPDMARHDRTKEISSGEEVGHVVRWIAERAVPTNDTAAISLEDLHSDYDGWCLGKSVSAARLEEFADEFDRVRQLPELAGKIRKFGNRYYGIRLSRNASLISIEGA